MLNKGKVKSKNRKIRKNTFLYLLLVAMLFFSFAYFLDEKNESVEVGGFGGNGGKIKNVSFSDFAEKHGIFSK